MKKIKKPGSLDFTVDVDSTEYRLLHDGKILGHYNTVEGLLNGARQRAIKTKTKSGAELSEFIRTLLGLQNELKAEIKKLAFVAEKKMAAGPSKTELARHTRVHLGLIDEAVASCALDGETQSMPVPEEPAS